MNIPDCTYTRAVISATRTDRWTDELRASGLRVESGNAISPGEIVGFAYV